jgi:hypothetical protein
VSPTDFATPLASTSTASPTIHHGQERHRGLVKAALYARVSTEKQERDATIASQLAALRQAGEQRSYQVTEADIFRDEGYSGARLDRPA